MSEVGSASIVRADSRSLPLADDSVDLIITSPPYFALRSYQDGGEHYAGQIGDEPTPDDFIEALLEVTRECVRVIKPTGSIFVNLGDKYSTYESRPSAKLPEHAWAQLAQGGQRYTKNAPEVYGVPYKSLMGLPWKFALACMRKPGGDGTVPADVMHGLIDMIDDGVSTDFVRGVLDNIEADGPSGLGLILRQDLIWSKENVAPTRITDRARRTHEYFFHFTKREKYFSNMDSIREGDSNRFPDSVRQVNPVRFQAPSHLGAGHAAVFPTAWPEWIINGWCPDGGTVLDPFGGTGTTALVAKAMGRHGISVDRSADYCRLAQWRTNDPAQLAKARGKAVSGVVDAEENIIDLLDLLNEESA